MVTHTPQVTNCTIMKTQNYFITQFDLNNFKHIKVLVYVLPTTNGSFFA